MTQSKIHFFASLLCALLLGFIPVHASARNPLPPVSTDGRFSGFDAQGHILRYHPTLAARAEIISHWAGYYRVNPILMANLIEVRFDPDLPDSKTIRQLTQSLHQVDSNQLQLKDDRLNSREMLEQSLARKFELAPESVSLLVEETAAETAAAGLSSPLAFTSEMPPALDLPFARPQGWKFNGVHTWTGDDDGSPMSSLDFARTWGLNWGDFTGDDWVSAAHDGIVTVHSSCFVQVQHDNGWATRYYHLDNLQVVNGEQVRAGDPLANYANTLDQALCSGGHSNLPHLHFALMKDGQYFSLQDVELSGFKVHPGITSYDQARDRMWMDKRETRYYAFDQSIGTEEGDNTIDYRYNGMWFSPQHDGHGVNVEITEFPGEEGSRKSVFIVFYTYDDNGLANYYVGNTDYARWRSDESMVVDMLQTAGGDFSTLMPIDFNDQEQVKAAGVAELWFLDCNNAVIDIDLDERSTGQPTPHTIELVKLIGVPEHVCEAASLDLPES